MRAFHDSRNIEYRNPYGAVAPGTAIRLALDVYDAPVLSAALRVWVDGIGEIIIGMRRSEESTDHDGCTRFEVDYVPEMARTQWYHFIIVERDGTQHRYGAVDGRRGGEGALRDWEPPSFQLTVHEPGIMPPAWHEPIMGYLTDEGADRNPTELLATLRENYPFLLYRDMIPWKDDEPSFGTDVEIRDAIPSFYEYDGAPFCVGGTVFGFWKRGLPDTAVCVLLNASPCEFRDVLVPAPFEEAYELIYGHDMDWEKPCMDAEGEGSRQAHVHMHIAPLGAFMLQFQDHKRLQLDLEPGFGVLAHITSLPSEVDEHRECGAGTLGNQARAFVDWLAEAGVRYWQVLPVNPTDEFGSPYAGISAFAGNVHLLEHAGEATLLDLESPELRTDYEAFCAREAHWLEPYAAFMAIRETAGEGSAWQNWPEKLRHFDPAAISSDPVLTEAVERWRRLQYAFDRQWTDMRSYANAHGIRLIGDMPLYVSADSADVWAHPEYFQLDGNGFPDAVAGCPPDAFSADGQVWGNPLFDWEHCAHDGYRWWIDRLKRALSLYDALRIDHFIGFSRYFSIPAGSSASEGEYRRGPGYGFFHLAQEELGPLPLVAEDLGLITPAVRSLVAACGFPGMDIVQFADDDPLDGYAPRPRKIVYTGTHDNQTLVGFCKDRYPWLPSQETARKIADDVASCNAPICIIPLQDILELDDNARMNVPGVAEGNWTWQADAAALENASCRLRELAGLHCRASMCPERIEQSAS